MGDLFSARLPGYGLCQQGIIALCAVLWKPCSVSCLKRFLQQKLSRGKDLMLLAKLSDGGWARIQPRLFYVARDNKFPARAPGRTR
jgi:hypothetical protein